MYKGDKGMLEKIIKNILMSLAIALAFLPMLGIFWEYLEAISGY